VQFSPDPQQFCTTCAVSWCADAGVSWADVTATVDWEPVLDGDLAAAATATIDAIARGLATLPLTANHDMARWAHNLSSGTAGWALFHAYRAVSMPDRGDDERAMQLISRALDAAASMPMDHSLYHGLAGLAWTVEHLGKHFYDLGDVDPLVQVDARILEQIDQVRVAEAIELMRGIIGHGVYALERAPRPAAASILSAVVTALEQTVTRTAQGLAWPTPPERLGSDVSFAPAGYINVGLAHGMTGIASFLARCIAIDTEVERARPLLDGAIDWLLAQRTDGPALFPAFVLPDRAIPPPHCGWCYGDLGIACTLELAGRVAERPAWIALAREIALAAAARPTALLGLDDAALCHGACGAGHLFNRLYRFTRDPRLAAAARRCFEHGLAMCKPDLGIDPPGLLDGGAGIGLALLAAVTDQAPAWDAVFLIGDP